MHALHSLFEPRNIAIVGASTNESKASNRFIRSLVEEGFKGDIFPVHPSASSIHNLKVFPDIQSIGTQIDLAMVAVNPEATPGMVEACARNGVRHCFIFTSGFAEVGEEGRAQQQEMVAAANQYGMRILGPNSMGMFNFDVGLKLSSSKDIPRGSISIVSQSGNVAFSLFHQAPRFDTGFSKFVDIGNQADIQAHECIEYLGEDRNTRAIIVYLEAIPDGKGRVFLEVAERVGRSKPVVLLRGGKTSNAQRAAMSHTGALAGSIKVFDAALEQAGIVQVAHLEDVIPVVDALVRCPPFSNERIAVVGSGGGHSILAVDEVELSGFEVRPFSAATTDRIEAKLPAWAFGGNPVDMTGAFMDDLSLFARFTEWAFEDDNDYGGALAFGLYGMYGSGNHKDRNGLSFETAAPLLGDVQKRSQKPIVFYTPYASLSHPSFTALREGGIPCYGDLRQAASALRALRQRANFLTRAKQIEPTLKSGVPAKIWALAEKRPKKNLTEDEVYGALEASGISVVPYHLVHDVEEAKEAARELGFPVVLKAASPDIVHKTEHKGVILDLRTEEAVRGAYGQLVESTGVARVLVASYRSNTHELLVGGTRDPVFGPCIVVGSGGVFAEAFGDIAIRTLPASPGDLLSALKELAIYPLLVGQRGQAGVDLDQLVEFIDRVGTLFLSEPKMQELDLNPVLLSVSGIEAADARAIAG